MARNSGLASLFDLSYGTGDPTLDALFALPKQEEPEYPEAPMPEGSAPAYTSGQTAPTRRSKPSKSGNTRINFANEVLPYAQEASRRTGVPVGVLIAHAAQETGWGKGVHDNNYFNITGSYKGQSRTRGDTNAAGKAIRQGFRVYSDPQESFNDLASLLARRYPQALGTTNALEYGTAIKRGGYAEDPGYAKHINERYRELQAAGFDEAQQPQQTYEPPQQNHQQPQQEPSQLASTEESPYDQVYLTDGQVFNVEKGMGLDEVEGVLKQNGIEARPVRPFVAPDGRQFNVEYDMTDDEVMNILNKPAPGESNYLGAIQSGLNQLGVSASMGAGTELGALGEAAAGAGFLGDYAQPVSEFLREKGAQAHAYGEELGKEIEGKYTRPENLNWLEENITYPAAETFGQMLPFAAAAPLAAIPGVGPALATGAIGALTHASVMGGGEQEALAAGKEWNPDEYRFPYAFASDAANLVGLGAFNKALKVFGKEAILGSREAIQAAVEKGGIEEAKKIVGSRLGNIAKETGMGELALVGGEVLEDAINREYLGKPLLDEEALQQYGETAKQVGPLGLFTGPMAGLGAHYNKATEVARLEEQADVAQKLEAQELERAKAEQLATVGVTPEQLQKFGVKKELEGLSDEELLDAFKADLAEKEAAKAAKLEALPEELRNVPYKEARAYQQMMQEREAEEVPSEEVTPPDMEPAAPVEPVSGATPPAAEVGAEEIPEPFVRGRAQEAQAPEVTNPADILGLKPNSGLRKKLQGLDVNNVADHPKIDAILQKTSATFSAENLATLETKMKEIQDASQVEVTKPSDAGRRQQPQGGEEVGYTPVSGEGVRISDQEGKGIAGEGEGKAPKVKVPEAKAPEVKAPPKFTALRAKTHEEFTQAVTEYENATEAYNALVRQKNTLPKAEQVKMHPALEAAKNNMQGALGRATQIQNKLHKMDHALEAHTKYSAMPAGTKIGIVPYDPKEFFYTKQENGTWQRTWGGKQDEVTKQSYEMQGEPEVVPQIDKSESPYIGSKKLDLNKFTDAKTGADLLNRYLEHGTDEGLKSLASLFLQSPHAASIGVNFHKAGDVLPANVLNAISKSHGISVTGPEGSAVHFRSDAPDSFTEDTLVHELLHSLTTGAIKRSPHLKNSLDSLSKNIAMELNHTADMLAYHKKDNARAKELADFWQKHVKYKPGEMLAYGLTSPAFKEVLQGFTADGKRLNLVEQETLRSHYDYVTRRPSAPKPLTLWDKFVDLMRKLFRIPEKNKAAFEQAVAKYHEDVEARRQEIERLVTPKSLAAQLDEHLNELLKVTREKGLGLPTKEEEISPAKKAEAPTPTPKPSKEEVKAAEERIKASGMVGSIKDKTAGEKFRQFMDDIFTDGRNTSFVSEMIDIREPISKAVQNLPDNVGKKLRSDYLYSAYEQRGNVIQDSYHKGFVAMGRDGTIETVQDKQLALAEIYKRVGEKKAELFNNVLVASRVRSIRAADAKTHAQANQMLNMADEMEEYAGRAKDTAKRKKFNAAARNLRNMAEKKLESINWDKGRTDFTEQEVQDADTLLAAYPELAREAENVYALLRKSVDMWENEGMVDKETAKEWREYPNYIPLYKKQDFEKAVTDPSQYVDEMAKQMGKGPKSIAKVHRQKWHEHAVFVEENLIRHIAFFASAAAEHSARKNTAYNLELVGKAERIKPGTGGKKDLITRFKENGKIVEYRVDDPAAYYAMQSAMPLVSPMLKRLRDMTGFARGVMIMNPLFWFRQAFREPVQASLVGRAGIVTPLDTLAAAAKIAAGSSKGYERLRTKGTIGPVDVIADPAEFIKISQGKKGFISKGITGIKHVHELMDAATRTVVYEKAKADALSKGFDEDTADAIGVMKAREIINFAKQGRSKFIRGVRATTPFFGAQLNSLDVMARAMAPRKAGHLSKAEAMEARRNFYSTAIMLATFSTAYAAAMSEDEDYLKEPDRIGNWLVPLGDHKFLKIPIPFEAGWFTKELPELMVLFNSGALNKKEALKEGGKGLITNVVPPMPTIWFMQPFLEVAADHDFFTGSSLEGRDSEVALRDRNSKASDLSKEIVNKMEDLGINLFGVSANQLEHINKKLLGQLWAVTRTASDAFINRGKVTPKKELEEYPLISGAVTSGAKDRAVNQFYEVTKEATEIQKSFERAKSTADIERFQEILDDPDNVKYLKASKRLRELKANIGETRQGIEKIMENPGNRLDQEEMTRRIKVLKERQVLIAKEGVKEARKLGLEI